MAVRSVTTPRTDSCAVTVTDRGLRVSYGDSEHCRVIRETFERVGDKWTLLVITILSHGPQRFTSLKNGVEGISQRMLTLTLRKLERDGLVLRTVYPEVPPRVDHALTALGHSITGPVVALSEWALEHHDDVTGSQARFDAARAASASDRDLSTARVSA
jgi:DNA-binding HxlR family transcriptional regulator